MESKENDEHSDSISVCKAAVQRHGHENIPIDSSPVRDTQRSAPLGKDALIDHNDQVKSPLRTLTNVSRIQTLDTKKSSKPLERTTSPKSPVHQRSTSAATAPELVRRSPARPEFIRPLYSAVTFDDIYDKVGNTEENEKNEETEKTKIILQRPESSPSLEIVSKEQVEELRETVEKARKQKKTMELELLEARTVTGEMRKQLKQKKKDEAKEEIAAEKAKADYVETDVFDKVKASLESIEKEIAEDADILVEFEGIMYAASDDVKERTIDSLIHAITVNMYRIQDLKRKQAQ